MQNGIPALYHYESFNAGYLRTTLEGKLIRCSNPANLNDPWDCKPAFDPRRLDDPNVLERDIAWRLEHPVKHLWAAKLRNKPHARTDFVTKMSESMEKMLAQRRIYCLTPKPDSTLMWSHYADKHRGICLEFSVADNPLFSEAGEAVYRLEYPSWAGCDINDEPGRVMELILTKSSDWCYEQEYRLISSDVPLRSNFLQVHDDFFHLPDGSLKSIIIGCNADHRDIARVIKEFAPDLPIKQAVRSPNRYSLEIVDYLAD